MRVSPINLREPPPAGPWPDLPACGHGQGLIVNADDWGRNRNTTDRTLDCWARGAISSASAMVFMEDSERAAEIARERQIDVGLHLNLTTPFTAAACSRQLVEEQQKIASCLLRHRLAQICFYPALMQSFRCVVEAQVEEFLRIYGAPPRRFDGHHHMHLCTNVLAGRLLPQGAMVRRSFSFEPGEKGLANRLYRRGLDRVIARRHRLTDFFLSLKPLQPESRLDRIFSLARRSIVEIETHPINAEEYRFLVSGGIFRRGDARLMTSFGALGLYGDARCAAHCAG